MPEGARVLVAGIGNVFLTDDGFGPAVLARLTTEHPGDRVRCVDYGIRGLHLAYDLLEDWQALVLVDAVPSRGCPGRIVVLELGAGDQVSGGAVDAHGMDPATVLASLAALGGARPPRVLLVGCEVLNTSEGMGLTPVVAAAVDGAVRTVGELLSAELGVQPAAVAEAS